MTTYKKVIDIFLTEGLMSPEPQPGEDRRVFDVTREAIKFPVPRSAALQMLARSETGALMCMAYSTMRGFGESHGTVGEMRVGEVPVRIVDPRGRQRYVGKIKVTEAEMVGALIGAKVRAERLRAAPRLPSTRSATASASARTRRRRSAWGWWRARCALRTQIIPRTTRSLSSITPK